MEHGRANDILRERSPIRLEIRDDDGRVTVCVEFIKTATTRYRSVLHCPEGIVVEFDGGSYNKIGGRPEAVPHDLAHLVVEDELELTAGVWGVLVAGGCSGTRGSSPDGRLRMRRNVAARSSTPPVTGSCRRRFSCARSATSSAARSDGRGRQPIDPTLTAGQLSRSSRAPAPIRSPS
jgi:hypothetical protein